MECFGHVLFEMTFGYPKVTLHDTKAGEPVPLIPPNCNLSVYPILEQIFESNSKLDIDELLQNPFFSSVPNYTAPEIEIVI